MKCSEPKNYYKRTNSIIDSGKIPIPPIHPRPGISVKAGTTQTYPSLRPNIELTMELFEEDHYNTNQRELI